MKELYDYFRFLLTIVIGATLIGGMYGCSSAPLEPVQVWRELGSLKRRTAIADARQRCKSHMISHANDWQPPPDLMDLCLSGPPDDFQHRLEQRKSFLKRKNIAKAVGLPPRDEEAISEILSDFSFSLEGEKIEKMTVKDAF